MDLKQRISIVLMMARLGSVTQVRRELAREGWSNVPTDSAIYKLYNKFCEFGTVLDLPRCGKPKITDEESTDPIMEILDEKPNSTLAEISTATNISRSTIQRRIKHDIGQKSYKLQIHQQLEEEDYDRRLEMADVLLPILQLPSNKNLVFFLMKLRFLYLVVYTSRTVVSGDTKNQLKSTKNHCIVKKLMFGVLCRPIKLLVLISSKSRVSMVKITSIY